LCNLKPRNLNIIKNIVDLSIIDKSISQFLIIEKSILSLEFTYFPKIIGLEKGAYSAKSSIKKG
jgi:hypothetical protein